MVRDRRATTALEFALVAPVLVVILFGTVEASLVVWTWQALEATADDTSRCVAIGSSLCAASPASYAVQRAGAYGIAVTPSEVAVTSASGTCGTPAGTTVTQVAIVVPFSSAAAILKPLLPASLAVSACYPGAV